MAIFPGWKQKRTERQAAGQHYFGKWLGADPGDLRKQWYEKPKPPTMPAPLWEDPQAELQTRQDQYRPYITQMTDLLGTMPSAPDLTAQRAGMQGLISRLEGGVTDTDIAEAINYAAQTAGFGTPEEYRTYLGEQRPMGIGEYEGLSPEERSLMEKQKRATIGEMSENQRLAAEAAAGATGSWTRGMAAADDMRKKITNTALQYDVEIMDMNFARKMAQAEQASKNFYSMVQTGQVSMGQYLQMKNANITTALEGYYKDASLALQSYGTEVQAILSQVEAIKNVALTELGIDVGILEQMNEEFELHYADYYVELEQFNIEEDIRQNRWDRFFDFLGAIADFGSMFFPRPKTPEPIEE